MPLYNQSGYGSGKYGIADGGPIFSLPLGYYLNLVTSEYRPPLAPKFTAWLPVLLGPLDDATNVLATMTEAFDLNVAVGAQLDILGNNNGISRTVPFQPSGGASPVLDDNTYRLLIRATIAQNRWDGELTSLQQIWKQLFPGGTITIIDNQNMTAVIILSGVFTAIIQDLITNGLIIPKPETVQYTYTFATLPLFGYDENDAFIAGYDAGHWT